MPRIANVNVIPQMPSKQKYSNSNVFITEQNASNNLKLANNININLNSNYRDSIALR